MASSSRFLCHVLVILSITCLETGSSETECQITKTNTISGNFQHLAKPNCSWTYIAPPGMQLLFKVDNVKFLPLGNSSLKVFADASVIEIPRSCVKCLQQISGHVVKIVYQSNDNNSKEISDGVSAFQIRYKAYYPDVCDKPKSPVNGFVTVIGQRLGQDIFYSCSPPYEMVGAIRAQCIVQDESPVPQWSNGPPSCIVPNCTNEAIERKAGSGAIASPSYPTYKLYFSMRCEWVVTTSIGFHIKASFPVVQLTGPRNNSVGSLLLYDGDENRPFFAFNETIWSPQNFSTKTNKLLVRLNTFNKDTVEGGFLMIYSAIPGSCPEPSPPHFGEVVAYSLAIGSVVSYRCMPGYSLVGYAQSECLSGGVWSTKRPRCYPVATTPKAIPSTRQPVPVYHSTVLMPMLSTADSTAYSKVEPEQLVLVNSSSSKSVQENSTFFSLTVSQSDHEIDIVPNSSVLMPKVQDKNNPVSLTNAAFQKGVEDKRKLPEKDPHEPIKNMASHFVPHWPATNHMEDSASGVNGSITQSNLTTFIIVGVSSGMLLLFLSIIVAALVYKKRHPMSMRFRRKFSTFENPMYVQKEPCHPRELKRLTV